MTILGEEFKITDLASAQIKTTNDWRYRYSDFAAIVIVNISPNTSELGVRGDLLPILLQARVGNLGSVC